MEGSADARDFTAAAVLLTQFAATGGAAMAAGEAAVSTAAGAGGAAVADVSAAAGAGGAAVADVAAVAAPKPAPKAAAGAGGAAVADVAVSAAAVAAPNPTKPATRPAAKPAAKAVANSKAALAVSTPRVHVDFWESVAASDIKIYDVLKVKHSPSPSPSPPSPPEVALTSHTSHLTCALSLLPSL